ncbi:MAG: trypsin-like peptidase domain-containing protein [Firmicutes bacterium]|nr:trypsin-like peptidase domain-containing protein [Bacillota bacterium]
MDNQDYRREGGANSVPTDAAEIANIQKDIESALEGRAEAPHPAARFSADPGLIVIRPDGGTAPEPAAPAPAPYYSETIVKTPKPKKVRWGTRAAVLAVVCTLGAGSVGVGAGIGAGYARHRFFAPKDVGAAAESVPASASNTDYAPTGASASAGLTYADLFARVSPSVVSIATYSQVSNYFNTANAQTGAGSGIVFYETDLNVYIVTNYHVVGGATSVTVAFGESDPVDAASVGSDSLSDVAVISVSKADMAKAGITVYAVASFGDSDRMSIGDPVMAIGNAMNEGTSATTGIVSGVNKQIPVQNRTLYAIQTNAAINPGNSGGPLVNMRGEVIGMNTAKLSGDSAFGQTTVEGMGYSMTSNVVKPIVEDIMKQKQRPFLGIQGADLTQNDADRYGIPVVGVLVDSVLQGTSAEAAGIQAGDIITSFNGATVFTMTDLQNAIKACQVGDTVEIKALRNGKTHLTLKTTLKAYQSDGNF